MTIPILQIVGYQDSGKTTLIEMLIQECVKEGLKIGTIKHHGHGGIPLLASNQKDTTRHRNAGAFISTVEGNGVIELTSSGLNIGLEELLQIYQLLHLDAILVEGYKNVSLPKVVLVKTHEDLIRLTKLTNIRAAISWFNIEKANKNSIKFFSIHDEERYIPWLLQYLRGLHEQ